MSPPKRQKLPPEVRQEAILTAARHLFNFKGFAQTSMDQVAAAAGLTKGGLYFHFKNKRSLYEAVVLNTIQRMDQRMEEAKLDGSGPVQRLRGLFINLLADVRENFDPQLTDGYPGVMDMFMEAHRLMYARREIRDFYTRLRDFVSQNLREGQGQGLFPGADPRAGGVAAVAMMSGLYLQYAATPRAFDLEEMAGSLMAIFLRGMGGGQASPTT